MGILSEAERFDFSEEERDFLTMVISYVAAFATRKDSCLLDRPKVSFAHAEDLLQAIEAREFKEKNLRQAFDNLGIDKFLKGQESLRKATIINFMECDPLNQYDRTNIGELIEEAFLIALGKAGRIIPVEVRWEAYQKQLQAIANRKPQIA